MSRSGRRRRAFFAMGMGIAIGAALIATSILSSRSGATSEPSTVPTETLALSGAAGVPKMLEGIPQDGTAVGREDAPVTLVEYADLQCPYCAQWAVGTLPTLLEDYVRAGKLRIEFRGLAFIGPDSETALRTAVAAGRQDKLWEAVELLYANQGEENSGWVTEDFLARMTATIPGLQARRLAADRHSAAVDTEIAKAQAQAQAANVRGTPAFGIGRTGRGLRLLEVTSLEPGQFRAAIEAILAE